MAGVLLAGGGSTVSQLDALDGFNGSNESGVSMVIRTKRHALAGPAGDLVVKRIYSVVEHQNGAQVEIIPVMNGQPQNPLRRFYGRPAKAGNPERYLFMTPLGKFNDGGTFTTGVRGNTFGVEFRSTDPPTLFNIEAILFEFTGLTTAEGLKPGKA